MRGLPAVIGVVLVLSACASASASPSPSFEAIPAASAQPGAQECPDVDLRGLSGTPLDLTGTYQGNDYGQYDVHHSGSCVYWLGSSHYPGTQLGEYWTNVLYGDIQGDFTIRGHWGDVPYTPSQFLGNGELVLRIGFESAGGEELPFLRVTHATGGFGGTALVRTEALVPSDLTGLFGGNFDHLLQTGCFWVESGGLRYELLGDGGLIIRGDPPLRIEDERGRVLTRVGDPIRVSGQVSGSLGNGCVESAILPDEIAPLTAAESPN